jgi:protein-arginine kinase activator protein McsA
MFLKNLKNRSVSGLVNNFFNEVSNYDYIPTNFIGKTTNESGTDKDGYTWYKNTFTSNDGTYIHVSTFKTKNDTYVNELLANSKSMLTNFDEVIEKYNTMNKFNTQRKDVKSTQAGKSATNRVNVLKDELEVAIKMQKFEEAVRLRDEIKLSETNENKLTTLKAELETLVKDYKFEEAIEVRNKINEIESK